MIKIIFISIIIYIFLIGNTYAFLGEGNGLNLYSDIEKGIKDLKLKNFKYEISGGGKGISQEINKILKSKHQNECIKNGLSIKNYNLIVSGRINILLKNLKTIKGCFYKGKIDNKTINNLMGTIVTMDLVYKQKANNKSNDIYKISRIGIYSDGNLNNSQFDLISDIEDIDKIIFTKGIPYKGEETGNFDNNFSNFLKGNIIPPPLINNKILINTGSQNTNLGNINSLLYPLKANNNNFYVCSKNNQNSGFSEQTLALLISKNNTGSQILNGGQITNILGSGSINTNSGIVKPKKKYNFFKYTGNSWPCQSFFCIKIDFQTYSWNLLGGGNTTSIESYMNTTNGHLKKLSGTSLIQSEMTINNFQLGLKNLHLADRFHMGVIITKQSPPIMVDDRRKSGEYKRRLREYYRNNDRNYDRRNSLVIYKGLENEKKTVTDSAELPIISVKERDNYLKNRQALESKQNKLVENEFDHKIGYEDMNIFYEKFIPLESFTKNILNYSENAGILIRGMNNKPSN